MCEDAPLRIKGETSVVRLHASGSREEDLRPVDDEMDPEEPNSRFMTEAMDHLARSGEHRTPPLGGGWGRAR